MSETFFNPDLKVKPGGDEFRTMGGISVGVPGTDTYRFQPMQPEDTFFNPDLQVTPGGDEFRTMGGLEALPAEDTGGGGFDLGQFIGSAAQLAQLYPGVQNRPQYEPGLTDLRYTRSFTGGGQDGSFYSPSGAGGVEGPPSDEIIYQQPLLQPQAQGALNEALLGGLLGMDWTGAYNDYLRNLEAQTQDINISNVVSPTMTNIQQQSQEQAQYMGDSTGQRQDQDQDDFDNIDIDSYVRDILSKTGGTSGGGLDDFFNKGPVTPGGTSPIDFIKGQVEADRAAKAAAEEADKAAQEAERKRLADEAVERARQQETARKAEEARQRELAAQEAARQAEEARQVEEARKAQEARQAAEAEAQRQAAARQAAEQAERQRQQQEAARLAEETRQRQLAEQAEAQRQAAAAEAEAKRQAEQQAETQAKTAPIVDAATSKFQSDIANAVKQRDDLKRNLDAAQLQGRRALATKQGAPPPPGVIQELQAGYDTLNSALQGYNVSEIINNPAFARDQALQSSSNLLQALRDPNNPPPPAAVDRILDKVVDSGLVDVAAKALTEEAAKEIIQAAGGDAATAVAGDLAGPAAAALVALARGDSAGTAIAEGAKAYAVAALAAIPGVGQALAAAVALDSVLSGVLGYRSPVNEAVAGAAKNIDKAFSFVGKSVGSDPIGGIVNWGSRAIGSDPLGGIGRSIGRVFGFEEGGLVDLGEDSMYNEYDDYGGLYGLPFEVIPDMSAEEPMMFARGGIIPLPGGGKIARGPGGGLDDLIPTSIDGKRAAALSDGEFVIPADVVSMMGDGSSNAGAKRLYDLVRQIRQDKTGTSKQAGPLQVGKILERTMR